MGLVVKGTSGLQYGNEFAETGINLDGFTVRYYPQFKPKLENYQGQNVAFCVPDKYCRDVTITGEVTGGTGVIAITLTAAFTPANDIDDFVAVSAGSNAGGLYANEITVTQGRNAWRNVNVTLTSDPLIS